VVAVEQGGRRIGHPRVRAVLATGDGDLAARKPRHEARDLGRLREGGRERGRSLETPVRRRPPLEGLEGGLAGRVGRRLANESKRETGVVAHVHLDVVTTGVASPPAPLAVGDRMPEDPSGGGTVTGEQSRGPGGDVVQRGGGRGGRRAEFELRIGQQRGEQLTARPRVVAHEQRRGRALPVAAEQPGKPRAVGEPPCAHDADAGVGVGAKLGLQPRYCGEGRDEHGGARRLRRKPRLQQLGGVPTVAGARLQERGTRVLVPGPCGGTGSQTSPCDRAQTRRTRPRGARGTARTHASWGGRRAGRAPSRGGRGPRGWRAGWGRL
jgi:hypothetical protein